MRRPICADCYRQLAKTEQWASGPIFQLYYLNVFLITLFRMCVQMLIKDIHIQLDLIYGSTLSDQEVFSEVIGRDEVSQISFVSFNLFYFRVFFTIPWEREEEELLLNTDQRQKYSAESVGQTNLKL